MREEVRPHQPVHVSMRVADHVWNLRSQRSFAVFDDALRAAPRREQLALFEEEMTAPAETWLLRRAS